MYAIYRIHDKDGLSGWKVTVIRKGKRFYKTVYDNKHGGSRKAHAAAVRLRNRLVAKHQPMTAREFRQILRSSNTSGAPGVLLVKDRRMPQGYWQARLQIGNRQISRCFSVRRYGFDDAYKRAVKARAEMLLLVEDDHRLRHPEAKRLAQRRQNGKHRKPKALHRLLPTRKPDHRGSGEGNARQRRAASRNPHRALPS